MLGRRRRDQQVGAEGTAGDSRQDQAGPDLRRQRHPLPGDQAVRQALGADHLLLRERGGRPRHPALPLGHEHRRQGRPCTLPRALRGSDPADPRRLQRLPRQLRRGALPAGHLLRRVALDEPAAVSGPGEVRAPQPAARRALPLPAGLRAPGQALRDPAVPRQQRQAAALRQLRQPGFR
ncbi:hypothetical protein D3C76_1042390 [compost metagenome]